MICISLKEMIEKFGKGEVHRLIDCYSCPLDRDVESFLKYKAELYEQHNISRTYFILNIRNNEYVFLAFFTITIKEFHFDENLSRGNKKKYLGTSYENKRNISAILIGQLGKNYAIPNSLQIPAYFLHSILIFSIP